MSDDEKKTVGDATSMSVDAQDSRVVEKTENTEKRGFDFKKYFVWLTSLLTIFSPFVVSLITSWIDNSVNPTKDFLDTFKNIEILIVFYASAIAARFQIPIEAKSSRKFFGFSIDRIAFLKLALLFYISTAVLTYAIWKANVISKPETTSFASLPDGIRIVMIMLLVFLFVFGTMAFSVPKSEGVTRGTDV